MAGQAGAAMSKTVDSIWMKYVQFHLHNESPKMSLRSTITFACILGLCGCQEISDQPVESEVANAAVPKNPGVTIESQGGVMPANVNATTGSIEIQELKEVAVRWIERQRFWEMMRRTVAERSEETVNLTDMQQAELIAAIEAYLEFDRNYDLLYRDCQERVDQLKNAVVDDMILEGLKGRFHIPKGTRQRRNELPDFGEVERLGTIGEVRQKLLAGTLTQGDLFYFSVAARISMQLYAELRSIELQIDECCLSFPMDLALLADLFVGCYETQSLELASRMVIREHWDLNPRIRDIYVKGRLATVLRHFELDFEDSRITRLLPQKNLTTQEQLDSILESAQWIEGLGGGPEPLLILPEFSGLPSRDRIIEASERQFAAIEKQDFNPTIVLRAMLYESLTDEGKRVLDEENADSRGRVSTEFSSRKVSYKGPDEFTFSLVRQIDEADRESSDIVESIFEQVNNSYQKETVELCEEAVRVARLQKVFELAGTGADLYFANPDEKE